MLVAVSLVGRGNRQATTWVTCILAASPRANLDAIAPVSPRCMLRALAVELHDNSFVTFPTKSCCWCGEPKGEPTLAAAQRREAISTDGYPGKRLIRPRRPTSRYRRDVPEKRKVDSSILSLTTTTDLQGTAPRLRKRGEALSSPLRLATVLTAEGGRLRPIRAQVGGAVPLGLGKPAARLSVMP